MKDELKRKGVKMTKAEESEVWSGLQQALDKERERRTGGSTSGLLSLGWPGRLALGAGLALTALFIWWGSYEPGDDPVAGLTPDSSEINMAAAGETDAVEKVDAGEAQSGSESNVTADPVVLDVSQSPPVADAVVIADSTDQNQLTDPVNGPVAESIVESGVESGSESVSESSSEAVAAAGSLPHEDLLRQEAPSSGPGELAGVITSKQTGDSLAGVNVVLRNTPWGTCSIDDGSYRITNLPPGNYDVCYQMMSHETYDAIDVKIEADKQTVLDIALTESLVMTLNTMSVTVGRKSITKSACSTGSYTTSRPTSRYSISANDISKLPVDSMEEVVGLQTGIIAQGGQLFFRGGRSGEVQYQIDGVPVRHPAGVYNHTKGISGTGGTTTVNDQLADDMFFQHEGVNPFIDPREDSLSTFALDVDTGSYTVVRNYLDRGHLPPPSAARVEEFVNYFPKNYAPPESRDFAVHVATMASPFAHIKNSGYQLLRVGLKGRVIQEEDRDPAQLVLVIDTSGSMSQENRLGLVKQSMTILLDELKPDDEIGLVEYGSIGRVVLPLTPVSEEKIIRQALADLHTNGSTNMEEGLVLGYQMLREGARDNYLQRIILCSDGVANTGKTGFEAILKSVREKTDRITLSTIGFGMGNYNDTLMEQLADAGDGHYAYVDQLKEATRVLRGNLTGTLQLIARNSKAQIEFDPTVIDKYRLIGYENRDIKDSDFRNNKIDAGEIGSGHEVTALYEVKVRPDTDHEIGAIVRLRYEVPSGGEFVEMEQAVRFVSDSCRDRDSENDHDSDSETDEPPADLLLDACVAEFAEILRRSYWSRESSFSDIQSELAKLSPELSGREDVKELIELVARAGELAEED